jgi:hypothetical protein
MRWVNAGRPLSGQMAVELHAIIQDANAIASVEGRHNETKALAVQSILAMTGNWAKACQVLVHFPLRMHDFTIRQWRR